MSLRAHARPVPAALAPPARGSSPLNEVLLAGLFQRAASISGTSKKKADGTLAATRLKKPVTSAWLNERFRQTLFLIKEFRTNWNRGNMLSGDDVEYLRVALDTALAQAQLQTHIGDDYDLNPTIWAILLVQNLHAVRKGDWAVDTLQDQLLWSMKGMYIFLEEMHKRGDWFFIKDPATKLTLHRYRLPFKSGMVIPPKSTQAFRIRKGANRLSDWMERGGLPALHPRIIALEPPKIVPPPPLQAAREARRNALWRRVTQRAGRRGLQSVTGADADSRETRVVVSDLMTESRADTSSGSELGAGEQTELADQLEAELEDVQSSAGEGSLADRQIDAIEAFLLGDAGASSSGAAAPSSNSSSGASGAAASPFGGQGLSEYEQQRLRNMAANQLLLESWGLAGGLQLGAPRRTATPREQDPFPPGRSGDAPTRHSTRNLQERSYEERGSSADENSDSD
jgi:hypothetical protein